MSKLFSEVTAGDRLWFSPDLNSWTSPDIDYVPRFAAHTVKSVDNIPNKMVRFTFEDGTPSINIKQSDMQYSYAGTLFTTRDEAVSFFRKHINRVLDAAEEAANRASMEFHRLERLSERIMRTVYSA